MPRPKKRRRVCELPQLTSFRPNNINNSKCNKVIILTIDEYEALRLIDHQSLSQEECAERMNVARTTVQSIYNSARFKVAAMLVEGRRLTIEGGSIVLCDKGSEVSRCSGCRKRRLNKEENNESTCPNK